MNIKQNCLCGAHSYTFVRSGVYQRQVDNYSYSLYQCNQCQTVRVDPVPDISLYTEGYTASTEGKAYMVREKPWCADLANEIEILLQKNPKLKNQAVIDVGCNGGELVEKLVAKKIIAEGCDVDPVAVNYGISRNLKLFLCDLSEKKLDK